MSTASISNINAIIKFYGTKLATLPMFIPFRPFIAWNDKMSLSINN